MSSSPAQTSTAVVKNIVAALTGLGPRELRQVQLAAEKLAGVDIGVRTRADIGDLRDGREIYYAVAGAYADETHHKAPPLSSICESRASVKIVRDALSSLATLITKTWPKASRQERERLLALLTRIAVHRVRYSAAPMSMRHVLLQLTDAGGLLDTEFPGYIRAGLAPLILSRLNAQPPHRHRRKIPA